MAPKNPRPNVLDEYTTFYPSTFLTAEMTRLIPFFNQPCDLISSLFTLSFGRETTLCSFVLTAATCDLLGGAMGQVWDAGEGRGEGM